MLEKSFNILVVLAIALLCLSIINSVAAAPSLGYVYSLDDKGLARITVIVSGLTGLLEYSFPVYEQVVNESLIAFDENGDIVLADYNGTHITIYPYNTTDKVIVQFDAVTGTIENGIVTVAIHPYGPATVILPDNAGLLYFNDTPEIEIVGKTIKLYFNESAGYEIQYIVVNETMAPTTTTTTTISSPATTTTQTTTTIISSTTTTQTRTISTQTTTQTSSPIPTTTETTSAQTSSPTTTTSMPPTTPATTTTQSTSTISPQPTSSQIQTTTTSQETTTTKPPTYTSANTTIQSTTPTTTTPSGGSGFPTIVVVFIVVIIVLLILGYILFKIRLGKLGGSRQQAVSRRKSGGGGGGELVIEEPGTIDERDRLILEKIASKPMTISELAREAGLSKSTVWRRIRKLEREGYVKTREEGKYTYIEITDKGKNILGNK